MKSARSIAQFVLSGSLWALGAKILGMSAALGTNMLLARMLGKDEVGAYFLISSIVAFAATFAQFGLRQSVVKLVAGSIAKGLAGRARRSLIFVLLIVTIGSTLVGSLYYWLLGEWLASRVFEIPLIAAALGATTAWIIASAYQTPLAEALRGLHQVKIAVFLDGVIASCIVVLVLGGLWTLETEISLAQVMRYTALAVAASVLVGFAALFRHRHMIEGPGSIEFHEVVRQSGPLFVTNLASQILNNASLWIAGYFLVAADVALFGAAWKLVMLVALPLLLVNMAVQPVISELYTLNRYNELQGALRGGATLAAVPACIALVTLIVGGEQVLGAVYGEAYRDAALALAILSAGQLVNVWCGSCNLVLAFTGHQRELMIVTLVAGGAAVGVAVIGAKLWGALGLAIGIAGGRALQNVVAWAAVHRLTGLWTHGTLNPKFISRAAKTALGSARD